MTTGSATGTTRADGPRGEVDPRQEIARLGPWFHNLHLPDGLQTAPDHPLGDFPRFKWDALAAALPADLTGWTALDVGCNAGFYSFELARRGAQVVGIDHDERYLAQARWVASRMEAGEHVRFQRMEVYDLARAPWSFDLVLFMGVFYHLRYPLLALDLLARKTARLFVFQSLTMPGEEVVEDVADRPLHDRQAWLEPGWPKMAFIEHEHAGDPTNWWVPNHAAVLALLRSTGLRLIERPAPELYVCQPEGDRADEAVWIGQLRSALGLRD